MTEAHGGTPSGKERGIARDSDDPADENTGRRNGSQGPTLEDRVRDTTAETLFNELKAETEEDDLAAYEDASADSILDDADGHDHGEYDDGGEAVTAGSEIESLLIPERADGDEFRWVETGTADLTSETEEVTDDSEADPFADTGDLFAETEVIVDETDAGTDVDNSKSADADGNGSDGSIEEDTIEAGSDGPANAAEESSAEKSDGESTTSEGGILARILSFFGFR